MFEAMGVAVGVATLAIAGLVLRSTLGSGSEEVATAFRVSDRTTIAALQPNVLARVVGKAKPLGKTVRAPLSGRECVYYVVIVYEWVHSGKSGHWQVVYTVCDHAPFVVGDATGEVGVDPTGAEVALRHGFMLPMGIWRRLTPQMLALMAANNDRGTSRGFREAIIGVGETIALAGSASASTAPAGEPYRGSSERLTFTSNDVFRLAMSNRPHFVRKR